MTERRETRALGASGLTLVEILVALGLLGFVAMAMMSLIEMFQRGETGAKSKMQVNQLTSLIHQLTQEKGSVCRASFAGLTFNTNPAQLESQVIGVSGNLKIKLPPPSNQVLAEVGTTLGAYRLSKVQLERFRKAGEGLYLAALSLESTSNGNVLSVQTLKEEIPVILRVSVEGTIATISGCREDKVPDSYLEVWNDDSSTYQCLHDVDIRACGDFDGCTMRLLMQHEAYYDQVRVYDMELALEQPGLTNNTYTGVYGISTYMSGELEGWIAGVPGTAYRYTLFKPWEWMWAFNYKHGYCPGQGGSHSPAYADPYRITLMAHPHVKLTAIIKD